MFDWDDLKPFLAVARQGSTIAAARLLGVDQSTVQRRLCALERGVGYPLVRRLPTGYRLTAFGESLLAEAQRVEEAVLALQQRIEAFRHDLSGVVRVTCPEPLVFRMAAAGLLDRFHERYPGIDVQFVMSDKYVDLERGEADVALRAGETPDSALVARRIGVSQWGVYASRRYVELRGRPTCVADLERHPLIGFDDTLSLHRAAGWLREVAPKAHFVARNDSILGVLRSALSGIGLAALPTALGDDEHELVRVLGPIPALTRPWRVMTTRELRRTPRVGAFFDFMVEEIENLRPVLTGEGSARGAAGGDALSSRK
ncbi:MAG: LysR family transcriptional regulator [Burkholderiaceae bacterium]|nr:LysR family transcriptional regulator [Burkholderiaceae bacterium]